MTRIVKIDRWHVAADHVTRFVDRGTSTELYFSDGGTVSVQMHAHRVAQLLEDPPAAAAPTAPGPYPYGGVLTFPALAGKSWSEDFGRGVTMPAVNMEELIAKAQDERAQGWHVSDLAEDVGAACLAQPSQRWQDKVRELHPDATVTPCYLAKHPATGQASHVGWLLNDTHALISNRLSSWAWPADDPASVVYG